MFFLNFAEYQFQSQSKMVTISIQGICAAQRWTVCIDNSHHLMSVNQKTEEKLITSEDPGQSARICHWWWKYLPSATGPSAHPKIVNQESGQFDWIWGKISPIWGQLPNLSHVVSSQCTTWTFETCQVSARANRSDKIVAAVIEQRNIYQRAVDLLTFRWCPWTKSTSILQ